MHDVIALVLGFLLDQILGDPPAFPHPVRWLGRSIQLLEPPLRYLFPDRLGGIILVLLVTASAGGATWALLEVANRYHPLARLFVGTVLVYYGLAARSLARETQAVVDVCREENWPAARQRLADIVGRDTQDLPPHDIYRACLETVGENTTDGVVAPLFYAALGGPVGLWVYKAINTLDSMVGYRNPRYLHFGWAAARLDDLANIIPARLTYLLISLSALLTGHHAGQALRIGWRDGCKHPSPNSAWAEAAMAGALAVQLGGPSSYGGVPSSKPLLGEPAEAITLAKVNQGIRLMLAASWLALILAIAGSVALHPILPGFLKNGTRGVSTAPSGRSVSSSPHTE